MGVASFKPRPLYPKEIIRYALDRKLGIPAMELNAVATRGRSLSCTYREQNPGRPVRSLDTMLTERPWPLLPQRQLI